MNEIMSEKENTIDEKEVIEQEVANNEQPANDNNTTEEEDIYYNEGEISELEYANHKIEELTDKYLRQVAEFDNYRKRTMKEKAELIKNGGERVIESILPILDDFERALGNMSKDQNAKSVLTGIELIYNKFTGILKQNGLHKIETKDADFNTDYHEAIAMVPAATPELKGKVIDCVQTGYMLNDKVIRHAKVAVGE